METRTMRLILPLAAMATLVLLATSAVNAGSTGYVQTNLVTDDQSIMTAENTDPNLKNPWGISFLEHQPVLGLRSEDGRLDPL
jgi:hypothetical protein